MVKEQQSNSDSEPILIINDNSKPILLLRIWHSFNPEKLQNIDGKGTDLMPLPNNQKEFITTVIPYNQSIELTAKLDYKDKLLAVSVENPTVFIYSNSNSLSNKQKEMYENLHEEAKQKGGLLFILSIDNLSRSAQEEILTQMEFYKNKSISTANFVDVERLIILKDLATVREAIQHKYNIGLNTKGVLYTDFDHDPRGDLQYIKSASKSKIRFPITTRSQPSEISNFQLDFYIEINSIFLAEESNLADIGLSDDTLQYTLLRLLKNEIENSLALLPDSLRNSEVEMAGVPYNTGLLLIIRVTIPERNYNEVKKKLHLIFEQYNLATFQICQDLTWAQDIPSLILEDFKKSQLAKEGHPVENSLTAEANPTSSLEVVSSRLVNPTLKTVKRMSPGL